MSFSAPPAPPPVPVAPAPPTPPSPLTPATQKPQRKGMTPTFIGSGLFAGTGEAPQRTLLGGNGRGANTFG